MKKTISLKAAFWKFLFMLIAGLLGAVIIPLSILILGVTFGYATYADYSERSTQNIAPIIAATPDLTEVQMPAGSKFLRLDKNYQLIETTLERDDLKRATEFALSGKTNENLSKQYLLVTRENEYVILQYYIGSQFTNEWLNERLPSPDVLLYILIGINCILVCIILTARFAKNLRSQLTPLFEATEEVAAQNLDFNVGHSKVKEFEDVLLSFSSMKDSLKNSLQEQWKAEQVQKEQIAALAHDLKTPLTVIQGNIDLMAETALNAEQKLYADYITNSSEQMQSYIKVLIDISRAAVGYQLHKETVEFSEYMKRMAGQINSLCSAKQVHLQMDVPAVCRSLEIDTLLMERAMMNVINNALDHSPPGGTVYVGAECSSEQLRIAVTDEGKGFTPEALQHAGERFFMDDRSRGSKMHFGMGLYITASIMQQHGGQLVLENATDTHGAKVTMEIPL